MVFSSIVFLFLFLPITLTGYFLVGRKFRNIFLLCANLFFYIWGEGLYATILILCILINWIGGIVIEKYKGGARVDSRKSAKTALIVTILCNMGLLVYYKYMNFFIESINAVFTTFQLPPVQMNPIHLPLGISFFVFQAISYVIDVYRDTIKASSSLLNFAVYKSLFPQLIAGPIVRYRDVADQVENRSLSLDRFTEGTRRFILGLGKKVLIANTLASVADQIFAIPPNQLSPGAAWLGITCYTLQIYFDFSGYSDMAIGLGRMLGFDFLENFNYPYIAKSVRDFWQRWHISLSTWFRDYLYIPLGGNRCKPQRVYANLILVFFLCGLWHGASWTFVVWGLWHGFFLAAERLFPWRVPEIPRNTAGRVYTLLVVMIGWVFFRSTDLTHAWSFISSLFGLHGQSEAIHNSAMYMDPALCLALTAGILFSLPVSKWIPYRPAVNRTWTPAISGSIELAYFIFLCSVLFLSTMTLAGGTHNPFIYFRF